MFSNLIKIQKIFFLFLIRDQNVNIQLSRTKVVYKNFSMVFIRSEHEILWPSMTFEITFQTNKKYWRERISMTFEVNEYFLQNVLTHNVRISINQ